MTIVLLMVLLATFGAACTGPAPTSTPPVAVATAGPPSPTATAAQPPATTGTPRPTIPATAAARPETVVVPTVAPTPTAQLVRLPATGDPKQEISAYFDAFYRARTLRRGGRFDLEATRNLTGMPYQDYTLTLLRQDADETAAGRLLEVTYSNIAVQLDVWEPQPDGSGFAQVSVTRTMRAVRNGGASSPQTATLQFRLQRVPQGPNEVAWFAFDFLNPSANAWVSELITRQPDVVDTELRDFFQEFYAARSLTPGGKFDLFRVTLLTGFAYQAYTLPLLEADQKEADAGKLTSVTYSDISVTVVDWSPQATDHGGLATARVTRTSRVVRPQGSEPPEMGTYQYRLHRHHDETGRGQWIAVDFLQPATGRWLSESAGQPAPVPPSGHG